MERPTSAIGYLGVLSVTEGNAEWIKEVGEWIKHLEAQATHFEWLGNRVEELEADVERHLATIEKLRQEAPFEITGDKLTDGMEVWDSTETNWRHSSEFMNIAGYRFMARWQPVDPTVEKIEALLVERLGDDYSVRFLREIALQAAEVVKAES